MTETRHKSKRIKYSLETILNKSRNRYSNALIIREIDEKRLITSNKNHPIYLRFQNKPLLLHPQFGV